jgi:hypothetical protein
MDHSPQTFSTLREDYEPVVLKTPNGLLKHLEETTTLGKGNPSVLLRIPIWLCALDSEDMKKKIKSGDYTKISGNNLECTKKCQGVWVKLRGCQAKASKNHHLE